MTITRLASHRQPQALQPAAQRRVDHARADLDDHAAEQAGSTRISTATRAPTARRNCSVKRRLPRFVERLRDGDLGGDLAAPLGELAADRPRSSPAPRTAAGCARRRRENRGSARDSPARSASAAIALPCSSRDSTGLRSSRIRSPLSLQHRAQFAQIAGDRVELVPLVGQIEQRRRITLSQAGNARRFGSQWKPSPQSARRRRTVATNCCVGRSPAQPRARGRRAPRNPRGS